MPAQTVIQVRRDSAADWTSANPTLAAGEHGFETDTGKFKIGNGTSTWNSLAYAKSGAAPELHASTHESGGADELELAPAQITGTAVVDNDSRLTDSRTPTAHATSHESGGADELELAQSQITNLTTDLAAKVDEVNGAVTTASTSATVVRNITLSTSAPTGGADGDVWLVYEA